MCSCRLTMYVMSRGRHEQFRCGNNPTSVTSEQVGNIRRALPAHIHRQCRNTVRAVYYENAVQVSRYHLVRSFVRSWAPGSWKPPDSRLRCRACLPGARNQRGLSRPPDQCRKCSLRRYQQLWLRGHPVPCLFRPRLLHVRRRRGSQRDISDHRIRNPMPKFTAGAVGLLPGENMANLH